MMQGVVGVEVASNLPLPSYHVTLFLLPLSHMFVEAKIQEHSSWLEFD